MKLTKFSKTTITYSIVIIFNELPENSEGVGGGGGGGKGEGEVKLMIL